MTEHTDGERRINDDAEMMRNISRLYNAYRNNPKEWQSPATAEQKRISAFLERHKAEKSWSHERHDEYMRVLAPDTSYAIRRELRRDIHWRDETKIKDIIELAHGEGASNFCIRLRAPGTEIIPMKDGWERVVETWIHGEHDYTKQDTFVRLGKKLATKAGASKEAIKNACGVESLRHVFTYHFEALRHERGHWHGHCCGAHGNDTHRAMMGAFAQAAMYAWATDGKKHVSVMGRRTQTETDAAALLMPAGDLTAFVREHFARGAMPEMTEAEEALNHGKKHPPLAKLHAAMLGMNAAFITDKQGKTAIVSCADDRLGLVVAEDGSLAVSTLPEHASNTMYVSVGRRALFILNNNASAQRVYRSTIGAGAMDINLNNMRDIENQLLSHVPLILQKVMSLEMRTKHVYVDVVLGAESGDPGDPATQAILKNKEVRDAAGIPKTKKWDELEPDERRRCIQVHEDLAYKQLKDILTEPLQEKLSEVHGRGNLHLNLRIIRAANKEKPKADIISYTSHTDQNGTKWEQTSEENGDADEA